PIVAALGNTPATTARCQTEGDPAFVPPYDARPLLDTCFDLKMSLVPPAPLTRDKGWRAFPIWHEKTIGLGVRKEEGGLAMGYGLADERTESVLEAGSRALLAQEIRNARGGHYTFRVKVTGVSSSPDEFEKTFLPNFVCRLLLFRFRDTKKDPRKVEELASVEFRPSFGKTEMFKVGRFLGSTVPGENFPIGNGLGVAVVVEKKTPGQLTTPGKTLHRCALRIHSVSLDFSPTPRDENDLL